MREFCSWDLSRIVYRAIAVNNSAAKNRRSKVSEWYTSCNGGHVSLHFASVDVKRDERRNLLQNVVWRCEEMKFCIFIINPLIIRSKSSKLIRNPGEIRPSVNISRIHQLFAFFHLQLSPNSLHKKIVFYDVPTKTRQRGTTTGPLFYLR